MLFWTYIPQYKYLRISLNPIVGPANVMIRAELFTWLATLILLLTVSTGTLWFWHGGRTIACFSPHSELPVISWGLNAAWCIGANAVTNRAEPHLAVMPVLMKMILQNCQISFLQLTQENKSAALHLDKSFMVLVQIIRDLSKLPSNLF